MTSVIISDWSRAAGSGAKGYQHSLSQQEARTSEARQLKTYYSLQEDRPDVKVKLSTKLQENFTIFGEGPTDCALSVYSR